MKYIPERPLKVCHVNYSGSYGGATVACLRLAKAQSLSGYEVCHAAVSESATEVDSIIPPPGVIFKVRWLRRVQKLMQFDLRGDRALNFFETGFGKWLNTLPVDVVHLHWIGNQMMGWPDLEILKHPVAWTFHDTWPLVDSFHYQGSRNSIKRGFFENRFRLERDRVFRLKMDYWSAVAPSCWMYEVVRKSALFRKEHVYHINYCREENNLTVENRSQSESALDLQHEIKTFIAGASDLSDKRKGIDLLISAFQSMKDPSCQLLLFGKRQNMKSTDPRIKFLGHLNMKELEELFAIADWFICPSLEENFSNLIIEAMTSGLPVIALPIGGNADLVVDQETGLLAESANGIALGDVIKRACQVREPRILGIRARERTLQLVNTEKIVHEHSNVYQQLLVQGSS